jgi:hypothetical protein
MPSVGVLSSQTAVAGATFPSIATTGQEVGTSLGTSLQTMTPMPTGIVTGNLLIAFAGHDNAGALGTTDIEASTGWTRIGLQVQGTAIKSAVFARIADGGANDALSLRGAAQDYCCSIHRIIDHAVVNVATDIPIANAVNSTGNADPPNLAPGVARHWLWMTSACTDWSATSQTITAVPSGYTPNNLLTSASSTSSCGLGVGSKQGDTTSENPGTFTASITTRPWICFTVAIPKDAVLPSAPVISATAGTGQVVLTWSAPASGGAAITDYVVQYRTTAGPGAWNTFSEGVSATTGATVTGLTNETSYDFQVAAVNSVGQGPYSTAATATPSALVFAVSVATPTWGLRSELNSSLTSAAFAVLNGDFLVLAIGQDTGSASSPPTNTGTALTWARQIGRPDAPMLEIWTAPVLADNASMTVTLVRSDGSDRWFGRLYKVSAANASPIGASVAPSAVFTDPYNLPITTTAAGSVVFVLAYEYQETGLPTSSDLTHQAIRFIGWTEMLTGYEIVASAGASTSNLDAAGGSPQWRAVALEIKSGGAAWTPASLPNLFAWYDASVTGDFTFSSGNVVSQWNDKSGNAKHLTQGTVASQPTRSGTQNGLPFVVFDGSNDWLAHSATNQIAGTAFTFILAGKLRAAGANDQRSLAIYDSGSSDWNSTQHAQVIAKHDTNGNFPGAFRNTVYGSIAPNSTAQNVAHAFISKWDGTNHTMYTDSTAHTPVAQTGTFAADIVLLGAGVNGSSPDIFAPLDVYELVIVSNAISDVNRASLVSYLQAKWGF